MHPAPPEPRRTPAVALYLAAAVVAVLLGDVAALVHEAYTRPARVAERVAQEQAEQREEAQEARKDAYLDVAGETMGAVRQSAANYSPLVDQYLNRLIAPESFAIETARLNVILEDSEKRMESINPPPLLFRSHDLDVKGVRLYRQGLAAIAQAAVNDDRSGVADGLIDVYDGEKMMERAEEAKADALGLNVH